jgi:UDPglucose 6-dehydrogenase
MKAIGIIGQGFVGSAVREGMRHAFDVYTYDKKYGKVVYTRTLDSDQNGNEENAFDWMLGKVDGPIFICLPTPMNSDGTCNLDIVEGVIARFDAVAEVESLAEEPVLVIKSTIVPGTSERFNEKYKHVTVCFNPEFLTERNAENDFKNQDRIIIGGPRPGTGVVKQMYETAYPDVPVTKTSSTIAELVKYTTNCFLATKVSVANEIKQVCDRLDVDYDKVVEYATKDKRLGASHWSVPGPDKKPGFGGSCFPKDLNAFITLARSLDVNPHALIGAWETNLKVRPERDWEQLKGRAVTDE